MARARKPKNVHGVMVSEEAGVYTWRTGEVGWRYECYHLYLDTPNIDIGCGTWPSLAGAVGYSVGWWDGFTQPRAALEQEKPTKERR